LGVASPGRHVEAKFEALVARQHARVAGGPKIPGFWQLLPLVIVGVQVLPLHQRGRHAQAPVVIEYIVEGHEPVAIARRYLVVVPAHLANRNAPAAATRPVLGDRLVAQVKARARLAPAALYVPAGIDGAERRTAG